MATGKVNLAGTVRLDWYLLAAAFLAISASTVAWVIINQAPPCWDPADHIRFGFEYYKHLTALDLRGFAREFFCETHYYPPFYHLLIAGLFLVSRPSILVATFANLLLLAALMASIYWLGRRLYSAEAGLMAALILPTYHVNAALLHECFLDFALMCSVGVSLLLLVQTDRFSRRSASLLLGVALGLGMLCKQPYVFFLGLPVAYAIVSALRERRAGTLANIALALAIAALLASLWYLPHLEDTRELYEINRAAAVSEHEAPLFSYLSNLAYINAIASQQLQLPLCALFLIGLLLSAYWYWRESLPLYLCIVGGLIAFTFIANKDVRYTIPYLPAVALLSTCWLGRARAQRLKGAMAAILLTLGAISFAQAQWPSEGKDIYYDTTNFRWTLFGRNYLNFDRRPSPDDWAIPAMLKLICEQSNWQKGTIRVGVVPNLLHFNPSAFALYSQFWNYHGAHPYIRTKWIVQPSNWRRVKRCRYVITRDQIEPEAAYEFESRFTEWIRSHPERFIKVGEMKLATLNTHAVIYEQVIRTVLN